MLLQNITTTTTTTTTTNTAAAAAIMMMMMMMMMMMIVIITEIFITNRPQAETAYRQKPPYRQLEYQSQRSQWV